VISAEPLRRFFSPSQETPWAWGATCSTTPSVGYFAAGALLAIAGLLVLIPWWRRLVEP
jgi:hypothetical protein